MKTWLKSGIIGLITLVLVLNILFYYGYRKCQTRNEMDLIQPGVTIDGEFLCLVNFPPSIVEMSLTAVLGFIIGSIIGALITIIKIKTKNN